MKLTEEQDLEFRIKLHELINKKKEDEELVDDKYICTRNELMQIYELGISLASNPKKCNWVQREPNIDDDNSWDTECEAAPPDTKPDDYKYCPFCGGEIDLPESVGGNE